MSRSLLALHLAISHLLGKAVRGEVLSLRDMHVKCDTQAREKGQK